MPDFSDIALEYEKIKDEVQEIDKTRVSGNAAGTAADSTEVRQRYLPSKEQHYKNEQRLSQMFDKSSRAGAKSSGSGLIMPNGQKMFSEFHDKYTGTGRFKPQTAPDKVSLPDSALNSNIDFRKPSVVLYERCMDCLERVDRDDCVPNMTFLPPGDRMNPIERAKWAGVSIQPFSVICYLFCNKCPKEAAEGAKAITQDPIKNQIIIGMGSDGKPITLAHKETQEYLHKRSARISDQVFEAIKRGRENQETDIFYGDAII